MDIFNQVRISERNPNYGVDGRPEWLTSEVTQVSKLMIRINHQTGYVLLAERTGDDEPDQWFEFSGHVVGAVEVDEHGIIFQALTRRVSGNLVRVVVTRKGIYGEA